MNTISGRAKRNAAAVFIFVFAFALRVLHVWQIRHSPFFDVLMGDARGYDEWARRIAAGDWIGSEVFYQAPLYPYFLAVIYRIVGPNLLLVRIAQVAIGSLSCLLVADTARRLFSDRAGVVAGLLLAVYAPAIFFDGILQKSVLDVFFVSLAVWLVANITEQTGHWKWFALGLALGGLSLTRENALIWIAVAAGWALWRFSVRSAAVLILGLAIFLVPVAVRNKMVGGGFYLTTSQFGTNFFIGNHRGANGTYQSLRYGRGAPEYERQDATDLAEHALLRKLTPAEVSSFWTDRAVAFITSDPGAWLKLMFRKVILLGNRTEMADTEDQASYAEWSMVLGVLDPLMNFGILVPLAFIGILVIWSERRFRILLALLLTYSASVVLFYVFARYRYPLVPLMVVFASVGILVLWEKTKTIRQALKTGWHSVKWSPVQTAAVVALAVFANWPIGSAKAMQAVTDTNLATAFEADGRLDEAMKYYRRAISADADYAPAYSNLATALRQEKRTEEAAANYEQALRLRPDFASAHYNLANLLLEQGDCPSAVAHFESAIRNEPASADVHNNYGIALVSVGRIDDAAREFRQAIDLDPASAKAYRNLADTLSSQGRPEEAISALRQAAQISPEDAAVRYELASVLLEAGNLDEAIPQFRETLRLEPNQAAAHNNLGIALGSQGKLNEAIEEFRRALLVQPDFAQAQQNLSMALAARRAGLK